MKRDWIFEDNLHSFLTAVGWFVDYEFDSDDWAAIQAGIVNTNDEASSWFDYEFKGKEILSFRLARDPGSSVVHFEVKGSPSAQPKIEAAISIFQYFHLKHGT